MSSEQVTPQLVMALRRKTGIGMSKCKEALVESGGDLERAVEYLRKKGIARVIKRESQSTREGTLHSVRVGQDLFIFEINAETDFVVQNKRFQEMAEIVSTQIEATAPQSLEDLLASQLDRQPAITLDQYRAELILALGENIRLSRLEKIEVKENESVGVYSHMGGQLIAVTILSGGSQLHDLAKEISMQVAAEAPDYLSSDRVPPAVLAKEKEILGAQVQNKPPQLVEKIVSGKLHAFFEESCLLDQKYIKDNSVSIRQLLDAEEKKCGSTIDVARFERFEVGQL